MNTTHVLPKAYQRADLMPLYREHATYLLRCLKTALVNDDINIERFIEQIPTFISVATCHEIAINANTSLELETHQNTLGKEAEYTSHPSAKKVGRDLRVKIIWELVQAELERDSALSAYEPYSDSTINRNDDEIFRCPICGHELARMVRYRVVDGIHHDGTEDWHYDTDWRENDWCEHVLVCYYDNYDTFPCEDYRIMLERLENEGNVDRWGHVIDPVDYYNDVREYINEINADNTMIEWDVVISRDAYNNESVWWCCVENMDDAIDVIENYLRGISDEYKKNEDEE